MNHTSTRRRRIRRTTGATIAVAAAATGLFGATATAEATSDLYVAVAVGQTNSQIPVRFAGGQSVGTDEQQAKSRALQACQNNGGNHCVLEAIAKDGCAAAAANDLGEAAGGSDPDRPTAETRALGALQSQQGARVVVAGCTTPQTAPPGISTPPKPGPTVSWDLIVGGLNAHITDRSGVAAQCTYTTDDYRRSFALPAGSSHDLEIVPAVPEFRNWNVMINCDNGTRTLATTFF
ncbi:DUF4189 domain-containing protein [Mycobacterium sp. Y57]|uniref:DUF4189 domain-containing protein n=1 Tax=Mycolicibacterium xanthum TaxID=2796469 RepID=UPI001C841A24|nr:DUF4189 domain-containing protein [Mycolicibacterium xanthum]MBX7432073.1 DUF4189 domain-containing protein [Mycolicibacterium xanthum]